MTACTPAACQPVNLTPQPKQREWRLFFNGRGSGIQKRDGSLVFAAQFKGADNTPHSCFIQSRDACVTWTVSPPAIPGKPPTSEAQIAECGNGWLLLSMRDESRSGKRAWARWDGAKWSEPWHDLPDRRPRARANYGTHEHRVVAWNASAAPHFQGNH